jgi:hypothetical protein
MNPSALISPFIRGLPASRMLAGALLAVTLLATGPSNTRAQVTSSVGRGSRVRISSSALGLTHAVGTVQGATGEALVIQFQFPRHQATVQRDAIEKMEVSIRRETRILKGLGVGTLVGAGTGAILGLAGGDDGWWTAEEVALMGAIALGMTGAVVGVVAGAVIKRDVWASTAQPKLGMTILPLVDEGRTAVHIGLSIRTR